MNQPIEKKIETHIVCDKRLKKEGGKSLCCECNPHDACCGKIEENCATNCPCHQSESIEWEKNLDYNSTDFGEMGKFIRVEYAKNILEKAITTAVSNREKEIAEEVEKKSFRGFVPYEQDYLIKKEDVLSILKH